MPTGDGVSVLARREAYRLWCRQFIIEHDVKVATVNADGTPARWITVPESKPGRVLLYLHGGAYVVGGSEGHVEMVSRFARSCGAAALLIDYPLAPENPFPAARRSSTRAFQWLLSQGYEASQVTICGESAGGGLTISTAVAVRDAALPLPGSLVAMSPWVDLTCTNPAFETGNDSFVSRESLKASAGHYLGTTPATDPSASPLFADLTGLPRLLIQVGSQEVLRGDAEALARAAEAVGVEVSLSVFEGMPHLWHHFGSQLEASVDALVEVADHVHGIPRGESW
ncbi:alpha/beta hydrolase [Aeromicrobium sp. 9AM]|uniref:alpha/beta hydrolase n=1 Tax=Aeromicrobium sp. 9AM TaxID=2653126 RepID=UPI001F1F23BB|nr:alpha/beta hydrolase [Aeromicrobium sp. 9AM]